MPHDRRENWLGLLSFGFFIMLFALFFVIVPDYGSIAVDFLNDFIKPKEVTPGLFLPAPGNNSEVNETVYGAVMYFCIVFGLFQFSILAFRLYFRSAVRKIAETFSNIIFWLGSAYAFYLLWSEAVEWFPFIGGMIAVGGFSIIVRSLVTLLFWRRSQSTQ